MLIKERNVLDNNKQQPLRYRGIKCIVPFVLLVTTIAYYKHIISYMDMSSLQSPLFPIDFVNSIGITIAIYILCSMWPNGVMNILKNGLAWCGRNSMSLFSVHCVEFFVTIPIVSMLIERLTVNAKSPYHMLLLTPINAITQIIICVILVWAWQSVSPKLGSVSIKK